MIVKELKDFLKNVPDDAVVYREGDEYRGDHRGVVKVDFQLDAGWNRPPNSVFII